MWVLPTLSRPEQCKAALDNIRLQGVSTPGTVFVNGSTHAADYRSLVEPALPDKWTIVYHPVNIGALGAMNKVFKDNPAEPFYGFIADDEFVFTKGWDEKLTFAAGRHHIANGNDHWQSHRRIQAHVCLGGDLVREVGYMAIPACWHWYGFDNMWERIAFDLSIVPFQRDVLVLHKHFLNARYPAEKDACYQLGESKAGEDQKAFEAWLKDEYPKILERLKTVKAA